jgi:ribonuclease-3
MRALPHVFANPELLALALTHASADGVRNNERLEFLGDAVLDLVVAEELFLRHKDLSEGVLTELKAIVVARKSLAQAARSLALGEEARFGGGMRGREPPASVLAGLFEAVLGAVYLDGGYPAARVFALATLGGALRLVRERHGRSNPKQLLQELCQARWGGVPGYNVLAERGEAHERAFLVAAQIGAERFPSAWGRTLKEAESWAAHEALLVLEQDGIAKV